MIETTTFNQPYQIPKVSNFTHPKNVFTVQHGFDEESKSKKKLNQKLLIKMC